MDGGNGGNAAGGRGGRPTDGMGLVRLRGKPIGWRERTVRKTGDWRLFKTNNRRCRQAHQLAYWQDRKAKSETVWPTGGQILPAKGRGGDETAGPTGRRDRQTQKSKLI